MVQLQKDEFYRVWIRSQFLQPSPLSSFGTFPSPQKESLLSVSIGIPPPARLRQPLCCFRSLQIHLFWGFHVKWSLCSVAFVSSCIPSSRLGRGWPATYSQSLIDLTLFSLPWTFQLGLDFQTSCLSQHHLVLTRTLLGTPSSVSDRPPCSQPFSRWCLITPACLQQESWWVHLTRISP